MGKGSSGGGGQVRGYKYFFSMLMGMCRGPIDRLVAIEVSEVEAWPKIGSYPASPIDNVLQLYQPGDPFPPGSFADQSGAAVVDNQRFGINKPSLFGGDTGEGGIVGNCLMLMGGRTQIVPGDVKSAIANGDVAGHTYNYDVSGVGHDADGSGGTSQPAALIPDFRGVACLWYEGLVCSNNPYPKTWRMRVQRAYQGWDTNGCWYPAKVLILLQNGTVRAMNAVHILYETITNRAWGRGMDRAEMDDASWTYAANRIFDEGFGLCIRWGAGKEDINSFIQMVVDHIAAVIYVDRGTGLMKIRLLRDDYDVASLPVFDYSTGLLKCENIEVGAGTVLLNEIVVQYTDPIKNKARSTRVHNLASIQSLGEVVSETKQYHGIGDPDLARRVAVRDLKTSSTDLRKMKVSMDRRGWKLQPGSVFVLVAPDKGIARLVVRVATYDDGTMTNGTIIMDCVQDVFGMPSTQFTREPNPEWRGGSAPVAQPPENQTAYEASYYDMQRGLTPAQISLVGADEGGIIVATGKPTANSLSSIIMATPEGGATQSGQSAVFSPVGTAKAAIGIYDTTIQLARGTELGSVAVGGSATIGGEVVKVVALDVATGVVTVARGAVDTIPQAHPAGTPVFFSTAANVSNTGTYATGESVAITVLPRSMNTTVTPDQVTPQTVTITGRHAKPYPPGDVRIDGVLPLTTTGFFVHTETVTLTWASRNKVLQADQLVTTLDGSVVAEAGTTYTVQVFDRTTGVLLLDRPGLTDLSTVVPMTGLTGGGFGRDFGHSFGRTATSSLLDLVLFTVVNGLDSTAYHIPLIVVPAGSGGFGNSFGFSFGRVAA